jgi:hypothetical protein
VIVVLANLFSKCERYNYFNFHFYWQGTLETACCKNAGKRCIHMTQSVRTLPWTCANGSYVHRGARYLHGMIKIKRIYLFCVLFTFLLSLNDFFLKNSPFLFLEPEFYRYISYIYSLFEVVTHSFQLSST